MVREATPAGETMEYISRENKKLWESNLHMWYPNTLAVMSGDEKAHWGIAGREDTLDSLWVKAAARQPDVGRYSVHMDLHISWYKVIQK